MLYNAWPDTLSYLFEESRLSQATFARNAGISDQTISRWVGGSVHPGRDQIERMAKGFGISVARVGWIFGQMMARHYREGAPGTNGSGLAGESEDAARPPSLEERVQALLKRDLEAVPAELKPALRAHRSELYNLVKEHKLRTDAHESRFESLIAVFEDLYESAARLASTAPTA